MAAQSVVSNEIARACSAAIAAWSVSGPGRRGSVDGGIVKTCGSDFVVDHATAS
jgi:hypothetical protein